MDAVDMAKVDMDMDKVNISKSRTFLTHFSLVYLSNSPGESLLPQLLIADTQLQQVRWTHHCPSQALLIFGIFIIIKHFSHGHCNEKGTKNSTTPFMIIKYNVTNMSDFYRPFSIVFDINLFYFHDAILIAFMTHEYYLRRRERG